MELSEKVAVGVQAFLLVLGSLLVGTAVLYRKYPPIQVKQLSLVVASYASGIVWWIGALTALRIIPQCDSPVMLLCGLWGVWVQISLGLGLWLSLLTLRFLRLHLMARHYIALRGRRFWLAFLCSYAAYPLYGIFASSFKGNGPVKREDGALCCYMDNPAFYTFYSIMSLNLFVFAYLSFSLRKIKQEHIRELKESAFCFAAFLLGAVAYAIIIATNWQANPWGKILNSSIVASLVLVVPLAYVGVPVFHCLYDRERHLERYFLQARLFSTTLGGENAAGVQNGSSPVPTSAGAGENEQNPKQVEALPCPTVSL